MYQVKHTHPNGSTTTNSITVSEANGDATETTIERLPSGSFLSSTCTFKVLPPGSGKGCPFTRALASARYQPYVGGHTSEYSL